MKIPSGWKTIDNKLEKKLAFKDFLAAMVFVEKVAVIAETQQHHPDILVQYNKVALTTTTRDAGKVTQKDVKLAETINRLKR